MSRHIFIKGGIYAASLIVLLTTSSAFIPISAPRCRSRTICYGNRLDKGFNLLEIASGIVPQGAIVQTAKEGWKFAWQRMMAELAPQDKGGNYQRPSYPFTGRIGTSQFPDEPGRYHLYVGNPCPVCLHLSLSLSAIVHCCSSRTGSYFSFLNDLLTHFGQHSGVIGQNLR